MSIGANCPDGHGVYDPNCLACVEVERDALKRELVEAKDFLADCCNKAEDECAVLKQKLSAALTRALEAEALAAARESSLEVFRAAFCDAKDALAKRLAEAERERDEACELYATTDAETVQLRTLLAEREAELSKVIGLLQSYIVGGNPREATQEFLLAKFPGPTPPSPDASQRLTYGSDGGSSIYADPGTMGLCVPSAAPIVEGRKAESRDARMREAVARHKAGESLGLDEFIAKQEAKAGPPERQYDEFNRDEVDVAIDEWWGAYGSKQDGQHEAVVALDAMVRKFASEPARLLSELVASLPSCSDCPKPAARAYERGHARYCDDHKLKDAIKDAPRAAPEYPRAIPLRNALVYLARSVKR